MQVKEQNIPDEMKDVKRWVLWKYEADKKPPVDKAGRHIDAFAPSNWLAFGEAIKALSTGGGNFGIGFVFGGGYGGIDFDDVIDDEGNLRVWLENLLNKILPRTYAEVSPSGRGIKVFFRVASDLDIRTKTKQLEVYTSKRYFTVTGNKLSNAPQFLATVDAQTLKFITKNFHVFEIVDKIEGGDLGEDMQKLFFGVTEGYKTPSEADMGFVSMIVHRCELQRPEELDLIYRLSLLYRPKWDERHSAKGETYGQMTIAKALALNSPEPSIEFGSGVQASNEKDTSFLQDYLIGVAGEFAQLMARYYEAPPEFWFFSFLTVAGHLLADSVTLASDLPVEPRLYTVLLGRSGVEKKSTAIRRTIKFFEDSELTPQVLYGVGSAEGLAEALKEHTNLLLVADEFRAIASKTRIEGSVLAPMLTSLFEMGTFDNRTKSKAVSIRNAKLSFLAASTTESYALVWDSQNIAIGLPNRLLIVPGEATAQRPFVEQVPAGELARVQNHLRNVFKELEKRETKLRVKGKEIALPMPIALKFSLEAKQLWSEWYQSRPQDIHSVRLDTIGLRLALLLAALQGNFEEIDAKTISTVIKILEWQYSARLLHDPVDAVNTVAELEEKIRRVCRAHGCVAWRDLTRKINANRYGTWALETAVQNLSRAGEIRLYRRGRSKVVEYTP